MLQLEVLLLLRERPGPWTADAVASELRITEGTAELRLEDLRGRGLVGRAPEPGAYVYAPESEEQRRVVDDLSESYATMRYSVINLIFLPRDEGAQSLAEAFRIRRNKKKGND